MPETSTAAASAAAASAAATSSSAPPPPPLFTSLDDLRGSLAAHGLRLNPCSRVVPSDAVGSGWYSGSLACAGPLPALGSDDGMTDDGGDDDDDECSGGASEGLCSNMEGLDHFELEDYLDLLKGKGLGLHDRGDVRGCGGGADEVESIANTDATNTHGNDDAAAASARVGNSDGVAADADAAADANMVVLDVDPELMSDVSDDIAAEPRRSTGAATEQEQVPSSASASPELPEPAPAAAAAPAAILLSNGTGTSATIASEDPSPPTPVESPVPPSSTPDPVADDGASADAASSAATPSVTSDAPSPMEIDVEEEEDVDVEDVDVVMEVEVEQETSQQTQQVTASIAQRHYIELDAPSPPLPPSPSLSLSSSRSSLSCTPSTASTADSVVLLTPQLPETLVSVPAAAAAAAAAAASVSAAPAPVAVAVGPVVVASNASSHRAKGCAQIDNARGRASRTDEAMSGVPQPAPSAGSPAPPPPPPPASAAAAAGAGAVRGAESALPDGVPRAKKYRILDVHHLSEHWMPTKASRRPPSGTGPAAPPAPTPVSVPDVFVVRPAERARRVEQYMLNMRRKTPRNYGAFAKQLATFPVGWPAAGSVAARRMSAQFVTVIWKGAGNVVDEQSPVLIAHAIRQRFSSKVERSLSDRNRYGELCTRQAADLVDAHVLTACATWTHALIAASEPSLRCLLRDTILMLLKAASPVASSLLEAGGPGATKLVGTLPQALVRVVTEREGDAALVAAASECLRLMDAWVGSLRAARQAEADARIEALRAAEAEEAAKVAEAEAAAAAAAEMQKAAAQYLATAAAAGEAPVAALQSQIVLTKEDVERIQQEPDYPTLVPSNEPSRPASILKAGGGSPAPGSASASGSEESPEPPRVKKAFRFHPEVPEQSRPHVPYTSVFKRRRAQAAFEMPPPPEQASALRSDEDDGARGGFYEPEPAADEDLFVVPSAEAAEAAAAYAEVFADADEDADELPDFVAPTIDYQTVDYSPDSPEMDADYGPTYTPVAAAIPRHDEPAEEPAATGAPQRPRVVSNEEARAAAARAAAAAAPPARAPVEAPAQAAAPAPEVIVIGEEEEEEEDVPSPAEALQLPDEGLVMKHVETTTLPIPAFVAAADWTLRCTPFWNTHLPFSRDDYGAWSLESERGGE